jgi:predicted nucleic-acid-binding protein
MFALDTNILVRYIVQDDVEQSAIANSIIDGLNPDNSAFIACVVLCELNWVLKSGYKISKEQAIEILEKIITIPVFDIEHFDCCLKALKSYKNGQADFSDYLILEIATLNGYKAVMTFDKNALKSDGFQNIKESKLS